MCSEKVTELLITDYLYINFKMQKNAASLYWYVIIGL